jgi:hypothetical protein
VKAGKEVPESWQKLVDKNVPQNAEQDKLAKMQTAATVAIQKLNEIKAAKEKVIAEAKVGGCWNDRIDGGGIHSDCRGFT